MMRKGLLVISLLLILVFSSACALSQVFETKILPLLKPTPTESEIMADCWIFFYLSAWIDTNGDGLWDESEAPLPDVEFHIDGRRIAYINSKYPGVSDENGLCTLLIYYPGFCAAAEYEITAIPPESYQPTTPNSLSLYLNIDEFSKNAAFGFQ
jgi:hypothetical protein